MRGDPDSSGMAALIAVLIPAVAVAALGCAAQRAAAEPAQGEDLTRLSLADLANVQVTSVLKSPEPLSQAAASVFVITHDAIVRSGVSTLIGALRLAPNLLVTQYGSNNFVIAARGFGGNPSAQNFSNKLLVLIDGRSVYSPLYSGIYLDTLDVVMDDIERIEVISGPGATLWGANAMNGVINIITRTAYLTDDALLRADAGNQVRLLSARYGDKISDETSFRVYGKGFWRDTEKLADGSDANDGWGKGQAGFRLDRSGDRDRLTLQGDVYRGTENQPATGDLLVAGGNALVHWQHLSERSTVDLKAYADQTERVGPIGDGAFVLHTYDLELQQTLTAGSRQTLVWGAGERLNSYGITDTATLLFSPPQRSLSLANVFAQDTLSIGRSFKFTAGLKLEDDPYTGWSTLPDARMSFTLSDGSVLWGAASRAIRSATPFDHDVIEKLGTVEFLTGNAGFSPERVSAYEAGYRSRPASNFSLSVSAFFNVYDDLRSIEARSATVLLPLQWGNMMRGDTWGVEAWANWQVNDWWVLSPGLTALHESLSYKPGASQLLGIAEAGDDPSTHGVIRSSMNLGRRVTLDLALRYVGALPDPALRAYTEMDGRVAWQAGRELELALSGSNLLHPSHEEFPAPAGERIGRSVLVEALWRH